MLLLLLFTHTHTHTHIKKPFQKRFVDEYIV